MDAFAVSIGISIHLKKASYRQIFRVAWHFGLFQFLMPLLGFYSGTLAGRLVSRWAHLAAFLILGFIGARMIVGAVVGRDGSEKYRRDPTRGLTLIGLMLATSLDAFAAGISISFIHRGIVLPSAVIGLVAAALSTAGMIAGPRIGLLFGQRAELGGGIALILLGLKILLSELV